jgi:crotonobetainyl-CoA:carnitine CoA-transferase CaiB-like acyl-CoA transferase
VNSHPRFVPHGHFRCAGDDQWIAIAVRTDKEWTALAELATGTHLAGREDWNRCSSRLAERAHVEAAVSAWTRDQDRDVVVEALLEHGVAAAPVASFSDLMSSSWKADRQLTLTVAHPYLGETEVFTVPWKFGGTSAGVANPAPLLGADTESVLTELLGMAEDQVRGLQVARVLY